MLKFLHTVFFILCLLIISYGQTRIVSGIVTDTSGVPIDQATVTTKNKKNRVLTNAQGVFLLTRLKTGDVVEVLEEGYVTNSFIVDSTDNVKVILKPSINSIGEVTVTTALGFQVKKDKLTGAQSTIKGGELGQSGEVSTLDALSSKASGLQVNRSSGDPGASVYVQIRGQSTITGNLQPLFIVDGIPVSNSSINTLVQARGVSSDDGDFIKTNPQSRLNDLNPEDIGDVQVLKGPAAAALWGTQAANGAIYISTKKGKNTGGKISVSVSSTVSIEQLNKGINLQTNFGQGNGGLYNQQSTFSWGDAIAKRKGGIDNFITDPNNPNYAGYVIFSDGSRRYAIAAGTPDNPSGGKNSKNTYQNFNNLFKTGYYWQQNVELSGGDDKTVYYGSFGNIDQQGIYQAGANYHRKSVRFNVTRKIGKIVELTGNFNYMNVNAASVQIGSQASAVVFTGTRTPADFNNAYYTGTYVDPTGAQFTGRNVSYRNPIGANQNPSYDNPNWSMNNISNKSIVNRFIGNIEATVHITPWLSLVERPGIDNYTDRGSSNYPIYSSGSIQGGTGEFILSNIQQTIFNNDVILRGNFNLYKKVLGLTALVGWNFNGNSVNFSSDDVFNFIVNTPTDNLGNSGAASRNVYNTEVLIRTSGLYAQTSFSAFDQLFLDLTARGENASSYNGTFYYPSVGLGWIFTKFNKFPNNQKVLSFGKLRASYGEVGVQPSPYLQNSLYYAVAPNNSFGVGFDSRAPGFGGIGGYGRSNSSGNANIVPEKKAEIEVGADLRWWNDRLVTSFTYYRNETTGAILPVTLAPSSGYSSIQSNAGNIRNQGYEVDVTANWINNKNWHFSTEVLWSRNRNKVLSLKGTNTVYLNGFAGELTSIAATGYALGVLYGSDFSRDSKGNLILDANGFPTLANSFSVVGDPNPDWIGSIINTIRYKNLTLTILIDRVQGGDIWNGTKGTLYAFGTHADVGNWTVSDKDLTNYNGQIIKAGTPFRGNIKDFGAGPKALDESWYSGAGNGLGNGFSGPASAFIEDGTRTRLREVSLGYSLRTNKFRKVTKLSSIDFAFTGRNLLLFTRYTGVDPETNLSGASNGRGIDYYNSPSTRSYIFVVRVNY
ncbi:MAG: SusC/RagA family TonB-linked outer membrane protein [Phycisphaerales bacterium]|nr:SusC/RagA family TonB-linked outer membrane protein [Phycisphaerales bacterium]